MFNFETLLSKSFSAIMEVTFTPHTLYVDMSSLPGGHVHKDNIERNRQRINGKKNPGQVTLSILAPKLSL
jgi:hypothetical protein